MQIFAMCMECHKELGHPSFEPFFVPYYEDRIADVLCSRGHKSKLLIQSQKFEVLMESGANALGAGFTLEAASSFSAAMERFYEFSLKVILRHRSMTPELYENMYRQISQQSERQLGAFMVLHALEFGTIYRPDQETTKTRNDVIHKGLILTPEKAEGFCGKIYADIFGLSEKLKQKFPEDIKNVIFQELELRSRQISPDTPRATTSGVMFFSLNRGENKATFKEALEEYVKARGVLEGAVPYLRLLHQGLSWLAPGKSKEAT